MAGWSPPLHRRAFRAVGKRRGDARAAPQPFSHGTEAAFRFAFYFAGIEAAMKRVRSWWSWAEAFASM